MPTTRNSDCEDGLQPQGPWQGPSQTRWMLVGGAAVLTHPQTTCQATTAGLSGGVTIGTSKERNLLHAVVHAMQAIYMNHQ